MRGPGPILVALCLSSISLAARPAFADALDAAAQRGALRVCIADFAPYADKTPRGNWIGREVDIADRLAADLELKLDLVATPFGDLIPALDRGDCDLIAASLSITPERLRKVWFSRPYGESGVRLVTRKGGAAALPDLDKPDAAIAVVRGRVAETAVRAALPQAAIQAYPTLAAAQAALAEGKADALAESSPTPDLLAADAPDRFALIGGEPLTRDAEAFAVRKGEADLLNYLNGWVEIRRRDGFLARTDAYWLTSLDWAQRLKAGPAKP